MKRREFITLLGSAAAWPLTTHAQQGERMRRVGMLVTLAAEDRMASARLAALAQGLQELGWIVGRNVQIETQWGGGDPGNAPGDRLARFGAQNGAFCWLFGNTISRDFSVHPDVARCETCPATATAPGVLSAEASVGGMAGAPP